MSARQLIVCCDGTSNTVTGGERDTNVVKMLDFLVGDPADPLGPGQVVYYDPGVGNSGVLPGVTWRDKFTVVKDRVLGLALGRGVYENVSEGYQFLMREWRPDDQVYFFGFSRGAFTARCIAGLVRKFGILQPHMTALVPTLLHLYFSKRMPEAHRLKNDAITRQIRGTFSQSASLQEKIHFVGTWDTVASVGAPFFRRRITADPSIAGKPFRHIRQALALDEHRALFEPRLYGDPNGPVDPDQTLVQLWFPGAHCDTGGGYEDEDCIASNETLAWLLDEARQNDLRLYERGQLVPDIAALRRNIAARCKEPPAPPLVHSQVYDMSLWAIAGLWVRETDCVIRGKVVPGVAHPRATPTPPLEFPKDTVWSRPRPKAWLVLASLAAAGVFLWMGYLLSGRWLSFEAAGEVACLQVGWWLKGWTGYSPLQAMPGLPGALAADLLFIALYGCVLAWFAVRAFATVAGLNRVGVPKSKWLNRLGLALPSAMIADVAENAATWAVASISEPLWFVTVLAIAMSLAAIVKWASLAGVAALLAWSLARRP